MSIEEERAAFLIECQGMMGNAYYPADTGFASGQFCDPNVQRLFAVWCSAKAHAAEQLKQCVAVVWHSSRWTVRHMREGKPHGIAARFDTEDEAVEWVLDNNYRILQSLGNAQ